MGTKPLSRVVIDDHCDGCQHARGRIGIVFVPGGPALCWWCLHRAATALGYIVIIPPGVAEVSPPAVAAPTAGGTGGVGAEGPGGVLGGDGAAYGQVYCGICVRALVDGRRCPSCLTVWLPGDLLAEDEARVYQLAWLAEESDDMREGAAWSAVDHYRTRKGAT